MLIKDSEIFTRRNGWPLARVEEVFASEDGLVRRAKLRVSHKQADKTSYMVHPRTTDIRTSEQQISAAVTSRKMSSNHS